MPSDESEAVLTVNVYVLNNACVSSNTKLPNAAVTLVSLGSSKLIIVIVSGRCETQFSSNSVSSLTSISFVFASLPRMNGVD